MEKSILHPGNGVNFPIKGNYIKLSMQLFDNNHKILFDSNDTLNKFCEIRYKTNESNMFIELENLIGEMSLFEKCSLTLTSDAINENTPLNLRNLLEKFGKIVINVEIVNISNSPSFY